MVRPAAHHLGHIFENFQGKRISKYPAMCWETLGWEKECLTKMSMELDNKAARTQEQTWASPPHLVISLQGQSLSALQLPLPWPNKDKVYRNFKQHHSPITPLSFNMIGWIDTSMKFSGLMSRCRILFRWILYWSESPKTKTFSSLHWYVVIYSHLVNGQEHILPVTPNDQRIQTERENEPWLTCYLWPQVSVWQSVNLIKRL